MWKRLEEAYRKASPERREKLGRVVRSIWVSYCREIGDINPAHVAPWETLSERDKEADRRIGLFLVEMGKWELVSEAKKMMAEMLSDVKTT